MVKICDAIMGSGKTSATIAYINAHPEKRFLYIAPYLDEAKRIKEGCPDAHFVEPQKIEEYGCSKSRHAMHLIEERRNITSTHRAMDFFTEDTFKMLHDMDYTVIIDEEISVLQKTDHISRGNVEVYMEGGYVYECSPGMYARTDKPAPSTEGEMAEFFRIIASRPLMCLNKRERAKAWYWIFPDYLFKYVDDVIVLTYMFKGSEMDLYMQMCNAEYCYIGIRRTEDGGYEFADTMEYIPEYVHNLDKMIVIEQSEKMNRIGKNRWSLSDNWYKTHPDGVETVRKNVYNYFNNRIDCESADRMYATYSKKIGAIRGKGYWNSHVMFNTKATNEYSSKSVLAYLVNVYMNRDVVNFYHKHGVQLDDDHYALSTLVQWIWRSAIRNGETVHLYLPSKRMRTLLTNWIEETMKGATEHDDGREAA